MQNSVMVEKYKKRLFELSWKKIKTRKNILIFNLIRFRDIQLFLFFVLKTFKILYHGYFWGFKDRKKLIKFVLNCSFGSNKTYRRYFMLYYITNRYSKRFEYENKYNV